MRGAARTLRVVPLDCSLLTALTDHHRGVKVKRVVVKYQLGEEPAEQLAEHTLVDGLRELVEIALVCPVVSSLLPSQKIAQGSVVANNVKVSETVCATPDTCEQAQYQL